MLARVCVPEAGWVKASQDFVVRCTRNHILYIGIATRWREEWSNHIYLPSREILPRTAAARGDCPGWHFTVFPRSTCEYDDDMAINISLTLLLIMQRQIDARFCGRGKADNVLVPE